MILFGRGSAWHAAAHRPAVLVLVVFALAGCNLGEDDDGEPQPVDRHRGTPDSLVAYFAHTTTFPDHDIEALSTCLAPNFRFYFTAEDAEVVGRQSFDRDDFIACTQTMFDSAQSVDLNPTLTAVTDTVSCNPAGSTVSTCQVLAEEIDLQVSVPGPPVLTYQVDGIATFVVAEDPDEPGLYVIVTVFDQASGVGARAVEPVTWGRVLATFWTPELDQSRSTPDSLINYFARMTTFPEHDITALSTCLAPGFRFHFAPEDAEAIGMDYFNRDQFIACTTTMFEHAVDVDLATTIQTVIDTIGCNPSESLEAMCPVTQSGIQLNVLVPTEGPDPYLTYLVYGFADFAIAADPDESGLYVIVDIFDQTIQGLRPKGTGAAQAVESASEASTWGHVLALFR